MNSPALLSHADKTALGALLHQAILRLCEQHTVYERQLRVMGVLCLGVDSAEVDVVVKLNDTLDKSGGAPTSGGVSEGGVGGVKIGTDEPRRKRKRLRPQRAPVHLPGSRGLDSPDGMVSGTDEDGLILYTDSSQHHNSEPLSCPVILPGGDDVSVGAAAAAAAVRGPGGDPLLCMGAREEGEISPPPAHSHHVVLHQSHDTVDGDIGLPALTDGEECGALQVDEEATDSHEDNGGKTTGNGENSSDEVEILGEYHDFRNITLLGTTGQGGTGFIIPPLSPLVTGFITNVSTSSSQAAIPLPTATTKLHITTAGGGAGSLPSQVQVQIQPAATPQQRLAQNDTEAKVARVVAAAQAAAQRENEAKAAAAASGHSGGGSRRQRSSATAAAAAAAAEKSAAAASNTDEDSLGVLSATNSSSSLSCFAANRVFKCQFCGKAFNRKFCLERHERLHTGVKPYECAYCGERYIRLEDKKRHIRTTHPGKAGGGLASGELSPSATSSPSPAAAAGATDGESVSSSSAPVAIAPAAVSLVGVPLIASSLFK